MEETTYFIVQRQRYLMDNETKWGGWEHYANTRYDSERMAYDMAVCFKRNNDRMRALYPRAQEREEYRVVEVTEMPGRPVTGE